MNIKHTCEILSHHIGFNLNHNHFVESLYSLEVDEYVCTCTIYSIYPSLLSEMFVSAQDHILWDVILAYRSNGMTIKVNISLGDITPSKCV